MPRYDTRAHTKAVAIDGATGVLTVCKVGVTEARKGRSRQTAEDEVQGTCTLQVAQHAETSSPVFRTVTVQDRSEMAHTKRDVRSGGDSNIV